MTIMIGEQSLATTRPDDLDAKLIAATGVSVAEHAKILNWRSSAASVARVLVHLLAEPVPVGKLAEMIAEAGVVSVVEQLVSLLVPEFDVEPVPATTAPIGADQTAIAASEAVSNGEA